MSAKVRVGRHFVDDRHAFWVGTLIFILLLCKINYCYSLKNICTSKEVLSKKNMLHSYGPFEMRLTNQMNM